uniref:RIN4 pathogenic type III effector avirulence factor Avr cleavage site domain-containing protein n=1 Tax=Oryza brachyantha TaxID=4533 RepID=J3MG35_ORYBR
MEKRPSVPKFGTWDGDNGGDTVYFDKNRQRPSAVPKFGVWDEQNGAAAAQGFTVMFDNVKRNRDAARGAAAGCLVLVASTTPPPENEDGKQMF